MSYLIRLTSPTFSYDARIDQGAPPIVLGRDQHATIPLPDPARTISRKHLAVDFAQQGVRLKVLSTVNGVSTANGELTLGQETVLRVGETAEFGTFQLMVVSVSGSTQTGRMDSMESDPFSAIGTRDAATRSAFDDAFFTTNKEESAFTPNAGADPFGAFASERPYIGQDGLRALQTGHPLAGASRHDPMSAFVDSSFRSAAAPSSIDDFLGARTEGNGLGAAKLLRAGDEFPERRLSADHVHDFNLPFEGFQSAPGAQAATASAPVAPASISNGAALPDAADPWAAIQSNWDAPVQPAASPAVADAASFSAGEQPDTHAIASDPFTNLWSDAAAWNSPNAAPSATPEPLDLFAPVPVPVAPHPAEASSASSFPAVRTGGLVPSGETQGDTVALAAFCEGLGVPTPASLDRASWVQMGNAVKAIVEGLTELMNIRAEVKRELRASDRTMLRAENNNPLKSGMALEELLQYVLFNPTGLGGYMPVNKALEESINDLRTHEFASIAAVRAAVGGTISEFEPEKLRAALASGRSTLPRFLGNARLWEAYVAHFEARSEHMADWLEQMFNRHFMPTYQRESWRMQNNGSDSIAKPVSDPPKDF